MSDEELKTLVDDIKKKFSSGEHVTIVCHFHLEAVARTIAEVCGLQVDKVVLQNDDTFLPLNTVIIHKSIDLVPIINDYDRLNEILKWDKDDPRLYMNVIEK